MSQKLYIRFMNGSLAGKKYSLEDSGDFVFGRSPNSDFALPDNSVSGTHATLRNDGRHWLIIDNNSRNGTTLNGNRLGPQPIPLPQDGTLAFANVQLQFWHEGQPSGQRSATPTAGMPQPTPLPNTAQPTGQPTGQPTAPPPAPPRAAGLWTSPSPADAVNVPAQPGRGTAPMPPVGREGGAPMDRTLADVPLPTRGSVNLPRGDVQSMLVDGGPRPPEPVSLFSNPVPPTPGLDIRSTQANLPVSAFGDRLDKPAAPSGGSLWSNTPIQPPPAAPESLFGPRLNTPPLAAATPVSVPPVSVPPVPSRAELSPRLTGTSSHPSVGGGSLVPASAVPASAVPPSAVPAAVPASAGVGAVSSVWAEVKAPTGSRPGIPVVPPTNTPPAVPAASAWSAFTPSAFSLDPLPETPSSGGSAAKEPSQPGLGASNPASVGSASPLPASPLPSPGAGFVSAVSSTGAGFASNPGQPLGAASTSTALPAASAWSTWQPDQNFRLEIDEADEKTPPRHTVQAERTTTQAMPAPESFRTPGEPTPPAREDLRSGLLEQQEQALNESRQALADAQKELETLQQSLIQLRSERDQLENSLQKSRSEAQLQQQSLRQQVQSLEQALAEQQSQQVQVSELEQLRTTLEQQTASLSQLQQELPRLRAELEGSQSENLQLQQALERTRMELNGAQAQLQSGQNDAQRGQTEQQRLQVELQRSVGEQHRLKAELQRSQQELQRSQQEQQRTQGDMPRVQAEFQRLHAEYQRLQETLQRGLQENTMLRQQLQEKAGEGEALRGRLQSLQHAYQELERTSGSSGKVGPDPTAHTIFRQTIAFMDTFGEGLEALASSVAAGTDPQRSRTLLRDISMRLGDLRSLLEEGKRVSAGPSR
ncbi:MAG: FHA domain-containing protein [Myxococcota bacterium]